MDNLLGVLEGILFVVGDEGITLKSICEILDINMNEAKDLLMELKKTYENNKRGIRISFLGDAFKLTTKSEHKEYYHKIAECPDVNNLSQAALEILAIIAYNQPITRVEVDELRGVSSSQIIRRLVARGFLKEAGKATTPGRPNIYRTTSYFLDYFGLATIDDLPEIGHEKHTTEEETELFTSIYKEN
ncbi:MAG: SMC-Scp complex subunit ScpB [Mollicutes bacterium]|jgi:segregation and condensation protein B|nr:SMC-Scp complex subunit ScpB [Mollicutes bacterium]